MILLSRGLSISMLTPRSSLPTIIVFQPRVHTLNIISILSLWMWPTPRQGAHTRPQTSCYDFVTLPPSPFYSPLPHNHQQHQELSTKRKKFQMKIFLWLFTFEKRIWMLLSNCQFPFYHLHFYKIGRLFNWNLQGVIWNIKLWRRIAIYLKYLYILSRYWCSLLTPLQLSSSWFSHIIGNFLLTIAIV